MEIAGTHEARHFGPKFDIAKEERIDGETHG